MFQAVLNTWSAETYRRFCAVWHTSHPFFLLIRPTKKWTHCPYLQKRAAKQKRCGNSYFNCSVRTKVCGRAHAKITYLAIVERLVFYIWLEDKLQYLGQRCHSWQQSKNVAWWERQSWMLRMQLPVRSIFEWSRTPAQSSS